MATYSFTAFTEADLLAGTGDSNIGVGDTFTMPQFASATMIVTDDDAYLSGDSWNNEQANDSSYQTAEIRDENGAELGNGGQIYAEQYFWVYDQHGNWYVMVEIEQEGASGDYFAFYNSGGYTTPDEGAVLTVHSTCNVTCDWIQYCTLDGGEMPADLGSISGAVFTDTDGDNTQLNATGEEDGQAGVTVKLYMWTGSQAVLVETTTTDANGEYSFGDLAGGWYYVKFTKPDGTEFVQKDVGSDATDSDVNSSGTTSWTWLDAGENKTDVDAGVREQPAVICGRMFYDADNNDNEWNDANGGWDAGVEGVTVQLLDLDGNIVAETTTDASGAYVFEVPAGDYRVKFPSIDGYEFAEKDSGVAEHYDSDADENGLTDVISVNPGQWFDDVDAGVQENPNAPPEAVDDAFVTDEETAVSGNVLENDSDPDGDPISVVGIEGGNVGEAFQVTTAKGYTGTVTLNADGSFSFTPDDSFLALAQDEQDSFQLTYTISDDPQATAKTNLLFVLDVSNSTVGQTGDAQDAFDGVGVGDVNGDGLADTVLDAEINAVISAVNKLLADGVDPTTVDIGVVTFSGLIDVTRFTAFNTPDVDAETVGTWSLDEAGLISALTDIMSGGWTNYEKGLQEAESWLSTHADAGEANKVIFLSDGRPVIDKVNGQEVLQNTSDYGDEVSRIVNDYDAEIHAIGVGANSSLEYLDDLDNTGGSQQVLDSSSLAVMVEDAVALPLTDTATITVTVNGLGAPNFAPDAVDDFYVTDEETAVSGNVLDNDSDPDGDPISVVAVEGGNVGEAFQVTTANGYTGSVTLNADGSFAFTPDDNFQAMAAGDVDSFQLDYTIADEPNVASKTNLLFVLDISNSTTGTTGQDSDVFVGADVGDVNGDGLSNTVLDAEIAAVVSSINKLLADGVDPSMVDVGIVTFSGVVDASQFTAYNMPTEDATDVGTWSLDEAALIQALTDIQSGGWTNYEAGLQEAEGWLADNADAGEANKVIFLSDGRPVITKVWNESTQSWDEVLQDASVYGDEVARISNDFGAEIHAIGVGANSDLAYLNDLDNTGGAVQVLNSDDLTVAIEDASAMPKMDTATVTVTINGLNEPPVAEDDAIAIDENGIIDLPGGDGVQSLNILTNDSDPNGDNLTIAAVAGGLVGVAFSVTTAGGKVVEATVNASGDLLFNTAGQFDDLGLGETDSFSFAYTIDDGNGGQDDAVVTVTINGENEPPTATNNAAVTDEETAVSGNILTDDDGFGVDADPNGDTLTVTAVSFGNLGEATSVTTTSGNYTGVLTVDATGAYTFTPDAALDALAVGDVETVTFDYTISDGNGGTDTASVTITINGLNEPPVAGDDVVTINEDGSIGGDTGTAVLNVLTNDSDPNGDDLTVTSVGGAAAGTPVTVTTANGVVTTVTITEAGDVLFNTNGQFDAMPFGATDSFTVDYTISDGNGGTDTASVTVTIEGLNEPPVAEDDAIVIGESGAVGSGDTATVAYNILDNDSDPNGDSLTVASVEGQAPGTPITVTTAGGRVVDVTILADGTVEFDTAGKFDELNDGESDSFTLNYVADDGNGGQDNADVTITVNGEGSSQGGGLNLNIVFLVDSSGSAWIEGTVDPSIFDGYDTSAFEASPGDGVVNVDMNNDGITNSDVDASLFLAYQYQKALAASGLTASVDIGVAGFSFNTSAGNSYEFVDDGTTNADNFVFSETDDLITAFDNGLDAGGNFATLNGAFAGANQFFATADQTGDGTEMNLVYILSQGTGAPSVPYTDSDPLILEATELFASNGATVQLASVGDTATGSTFDSAVGNILNTVIGNVGSVIGAVDATVDMTASGDLQDFLNNELTQLTDPLA